MRGAVGEEEVRPGRKLRIASGEVGLEGVEWWEEVMGWIAESGYRYGGIKSSMRVDSGVVRILVYKGVRSGRDCGSDGA